MAQKVTLENVEIMWKNFSGEVSKFNQNGDRTFSVRLVDKEVIDDLKAQGWNLKPLKDEDENIVAYHLPVKVSYDNSPPRITVIKSSGRLSLTEDTVDMLDYQPIVMADMIINPYHWEVNGNSGVKAYLGNMYVTIDEDQLDLKYADIPDVTIGRSLND